MTMRKYRVNADSVGVLLDILVGTPDEFNSDKDNLRGRNATKWMPAGRLNGAEYDTFRSNLVQERISYVIYSYNTPIAWRIYDRAFPSPHNAQRWIVAARWISTNTSQKHVAKVKAALSQISGGFDNV